VSTVSKKTNVLKTKLSETFISLNTVHWLPYVRNVSSVSKWSYWISICCRNVRRKSFGKSVPGAKNQSWASFTISMSKRRGVSLQNLWMSRTGALTVMKTSSPRKEGG
jgi:hypothetical protein